MNPFRAFKRWRRRREISRRLVAYAKTKEGRKLFVFSNAPLLRELPRDHFIHIGSGWLDK